MAGQIVDPVPGAETRRSNPAEGAALRGQVVDPTPGAVVAVLRGRVVELERDLLEARTAVADLEAELTDVRDLLESAIGVAVAMAAAFPSARRPDA